MKASTASEDTYINYQHQAKQQQQVTPSLAVAYNKQESSSFSSHLSSQPVVEDNSVGTVKQEIEQQQQPQQQASKEEQTREEEEDVVEEAFGGEIVGYRKLETSGFQEYLICWREGKLSLRAQWPL